MTYRPDLHLHTTASDGLYTPNEVLDLAAEAGLNLISLTDHDGIDGLKGIRENEKVKVIPGVELSASCAQGSVHILGYGIDPKSTKLEIYFKALNEERFRRFKKMLAALQAQGIDIEASDLDMEGVTTLGRPHIARALVKKGAVRDLQEAFARFLSPGKPAYVKREPKPPSEIIRLLRECGAVPVLAHPGLMKTDELTLNALLDAWQDAGLMGLEVYHQANEPYALYERMARARNLLVTGGSDFHGDESHVWVGKMLPEWKNAHEDTLKLMEALN
jgi:Predicted metal-dependent phosphoesterases (PHP family)